jgi:hypothetical protein
MTLSPNSTTLTRYAFCHWERDRDVWKATLPAHFPPTTYATACILRACTFSVYYWDLRAIIVDCQLVLTTVSRHC